MWRPTFDMSLMPERNVFPPRFAASQASAGTNRWAIRQKSRRSALPRQRWNRRRKSSWWPLVVRKPSVVTAVADKSPQGDRSRQRGRNISAISATRVTRLSRRCSGTSSSTATRSRRSRFIASTAISCTCPWARSRCTFALTRCLVSVRSAARPSVGHGFFRATSEPTQAKSPTNARTAREHSQIAQISELICRPIPTWRNIAVRAAPSRFHACRFYWSTKKRDVSRARFRSHAAVARWALVFCQNDGSLPDNRLFDQVLPRNAKPNGVRIGCWNSTQLVAVTIVERPVVFWQLVLQLLNKSDLFPLIMSLFVRFFFCAFINNKCRSGKKQDTC